MRHDHRKARRRGALWLLVLALVSVMAPVWADTYLCPMAKAAKLQKASCCAKVEAMPPAAEPGHPQLQIPCHCPKLQWNAQTTDHVREASTGTVQPVLLCLPSCAPRIESSSASAGPGVATASSSRSSPPLWLRHQSILC